jgi:hypothetical protein
VYSTVSRQLANRVTGTEETMDRTKHVSISVGVICGPLLAVPAQAQFNQ